MASVLIKRQLKKTTKSNPLSHWSDSQRLEAVTTYLMLGKWPLVAAATNIPIDTLKKWKQADWWKDAEEEIRRSSHLELGGKLSRIVNKAASVVEDRLEHGELIYNKDTKAFTDRKPVRMKEASEVLHKTIDRNLLLEKLQDKPQFKEEAIMDRLKSIEEALIRGAKHKYDKSNVIDVEPVVGSALLGSILYADPTTGGHLNGDGASDGTTSDPAASTSDNSGSSGDILEPDDEHEVLQRESTDGDDGDPSLLVQDSSHP